MRRHLVVLAAFFVVLMFGGFLRFEGVGLRSLWRDELSTWHVSRMPILESLRWGPALTKPPLHQFTLRVITSDPHPSEATLRFPAALCGVLALVAAFWLGWLGGGAQVGLALALLLAFNTLQIKYSQEARPYTMLVLGCALCVGLWYLLVTTGRRRYFLAYVVTATLTLYAHYLAALTFAGQGVWWLIQLRRRPRDTGNFRPLVAILLVGLLCIPLAVRYLSYKSAMFQGLVWIPATTLGRSLETVAALTYGWQWVFGMLVTSVLVWMMAAGRWWPRRWPRVNTGRGDICGLLIACFAGAWFGLLVISWVAHPAMVVRYALPAAVPALLLPLIIAHRLDRRAPLVVAVVFVIGWSPSWMNREVEAGFREMSRFLVEHVDPDRELVVLTFDKTIHPGWEDSARLGFRYYPIPGLPVSELYLEADGVTARNDVLQDPRGLYLIVLWPNETAIIEAAGRRIIPFTIDGVELSRLLFGPYRLVHVAPLP